MRRMISPLGIATSCALVLGACATQQNGSQPAQNDPHQVVAAAYHNTVNAKTAKITLTTDANENGKVVHSVGTGVMQFNPVELDLTTQISGHSSEVRTINGATYLQARDDKWLKVNTGEFPGGSSPDQALGYLQGASDSITPAGSATINGQQTTGYQVVVDLDKVAAEQSTPQAKQSIQQVETLTGSKTLPVHVWVDSHGRLVREQDSSTVSSQGHNITTQTTLDFTDFGTPVAVVTPPADQITS